MIKKAALNFATKFWWLLVHYKLCPIVTNNVLNQDGDALIVSMMAKYDIEFEGIIKCELHVRAFSRAMTLLFLCHIQWLCDEVGMPDIPRVNERL